LKSSQLFLLLPTDQGILANETPSWLWPFFMGSAFVKKARASGIALTIIEEPHPDKHLQGVAKDLSIAAT
jgi:hypothetical protein